MADLRTCIGSAKFSLERHEAPTADFPVQPSQKDGLGRMCKPHWKEYVRGLTRDAKARKAEAQGGAEPTVQSQAAARVATKRAARVTRPAPGFGVFAEPVVPPPTKLPETLAEVGSDEGQAALAAAAKAARTARRGG